MNTIYKSASLGGQQILPCGVVFPPQQKDMGFVVTWKKGSLGLDHVLLTKVDGYSPTIEKDYQERLHIVNKASLQISHIEAKDQDWYECSILFTNGNRETPMNNTWIYLTVHSPPHITRSSGTLLNVPKGERAKLFCEGKGSPEPKITWTKDGQILNNTARTTVDKNEVRINNVQREDGGIYTCMFSNIVGDRSQPIKLVVEGGPYIMTLPGNQTVQEGQRVTFPCGTEGYPSTIVHTWYRDTMEIRNSDGYRAGRIILMSDGSLVIKTTVKDDKGWYTCRPSNGLGQDEASAYLNVVYKPVVRPMPPQLVWAKGFTQRIDCLVDSNPPLQSVYWVKDQEQISSAGRFEVLSNGSLVVSDVEESDAGSYRCTPENAMGQGLSSNRVQVTVKDPPQITVGPEPLYVKQVGGHVLMHCEATGVPTVSIHWIKIGGGLLHNNKRVAITDKHLEIKNITKEDHGKYECQAVNAINTVVAVTELRIDSTTPHAPYNVTITPGLFNVTISWEPAYDGGDPQSYVVWFKRSAQSDWLTMPVPGHEVTDFTLHKLQPNTEYEFKVVALNSLGNGTFSNIIKQSTLEYSADAVNILPSDQDGVPYYPEIQENHGIQPSPPLNVSAYVRGRDIFLKWRPPPNSPVPIFSYRIEYQHDGKWQVYNHRIAGNTSSSVVLPNMLSGTYHIWIRSYGVLAYSVTSNTVRVRVSNDGVLIPQALIGGIIGGVLFLLVAILLALVAVFYSRRKERKAKEKHYNGVSYGKPQEMNGRYPEPETKWDRWQRHGRRDLMTNPGTTESIFFLPQTHSHNQPIRTVRPLMLLQNVHDRNRFHGGGRDSGHTTVQQVPWTNQSSSLGRNRQPGSFRQKLSKANLKIGNMTWPDENSDDRSRSQFSEQLLPGSDSHLPKIHPIVHDSPHLPNSQKHPAISQSHPSLSKSYSFPSYHNKNTRHISTANLKHRKLQPAYLPPSASYPSCHNKNTRHISNVNLQHRNLQPVYIPPSASYPSYFQPAFLDRSCVNPSNKSCHNSTAVITGQRGACSDIHHVFRKSHQLPTYRETRSTHFSGSQIPLPQLSDPYKVQLHQQSGLHDASLSHPENPLGVSLSQISNQHDGPCFQGSRHMKPDRSVHRTTKTNYPPATSAGHLQLNVSKHLSSDEDLNTAKHESTNISPICHVGTKGSKRFIPYATFIQPHGHSIRDSDDHCNTCSSHSILQNTAQQYSQRSTATCQISQPTSLQKVRNASFSRAISQSGSHLLGSPEQVQKKCQGYSSSRSFDRHSDGNLQPRKNSQIPQGHSNMAPMKQVSFTRRNSFRQHQTHLSIPKSHSVPQPQRYVSHSHSTPQSLRKLPIFQSHSSHSPYYKRNVHTGFKNPKQCVTFEISNNRNYKSPDSPYYGGGHDIASHKVPAGSWPLASVRCPLSSASYPDLTVRPPARTSSEARQEWSRFPHGQNYPRSKSHEANMDLYAHNSSPKLKPQRSHPRHKVSFYSANNIASLCSKPGPSEIGIIDSKIVSDVSHQRHSDVACLPSDDITATCLDSSHSVRTNRSCKVESQGYDQFESGRVETNPGQNDHNRECGREDYYNRHVNYQKSGNKPFHKDDCLRNFYKTTNPRCGKAGQIKAHADISPLPQYWYPDFENRLQRLREEFQEYKQQKQASFTGQSASLTSYGMSKRVNTSLMYSMDSEML